MENRLNILGGLASLVSLAIAALPFAFPNPNSTYIQSVAAFGVFAILICLFVWMRKFDVVKKASVKKEELIRLGRIQIGLASSKVVIFSHDLSWANDYAEAIRGRIQKNCVVVVIHRKSDNDTVKQNSAYLKGIGVQTIELEEDHGLRATLIDPDNPSTARLFVAHKSRRDGSINPTSPGLSGTDEDFYYECAVYQRGADQVLIRALARIVTTALLKKAD